MSSYTPHLTIPKLAGPVFCLSVSEDGKLASGGKLRVVNNNWFPTSDITGMEGTQLWKLPNAKRIAIPCEAGARGATTSLIWAKRDDEPDDVLFYGTQGGILVGWKEVKHEKVVSKFLN